MKVDKTKSGKPVNHGLPSSYNNHKCRCRDCKDAWAKYINDRGYVKKSREKKRKAKAEAAKTVKFSSDF